VCLALIAVAFARASPEQAAPAGQQPGRPTAARAVVAVKRGVVVDVRFPRSLRPNDLRVGEPVELEVARDVHVGGHPVLLEGAAATGHVEEAEVRHAAGFPARLEVVVDSATAVDGSTVPLTGIYTASGRDRHVEAAGIALYYCICGLLIQGEDTLIGRHTIVTCFVRSDTRVTVCEGAPECWGGSTLSWVWFW
jgi:hypothetical protein